MKMSSRVSRSLVVSAGTFWLALAAGHASAAQLNLPTNPLFVSNEVAPNIMLMIDSSGSMTNVVADFPYDPNTTYLALSACPAANRVPNNVQVNLNIRTSNQSGNNGPKITYSGNRYNWGTGSGERCFDPNLDYLAGLNVDAEAANTNGDWWVPAFLPASYSGNYLNWYFNPNNYASPTYGGTGPVTWNARQRTKPLPTALVPEGKVLSRINVARPAGETLVNGLDSRLRVGLSIYNGNDGGSMRVNVGNLTATQRTALTTGTNGIANITPAGNTPLAETLSDIGRYFATGYSGDLTMTPKNPPRTVTRTVAQAFPSNLSGASATAPVTLSCQQNFAVLLTDGRPTEDRTSSQLAIGSAPNDVITDYDGDCYNRDPACLSFDQKPNQSYETTGSDYLDDVAQALFETDLRPELPVETSSGQQFKNNVVTHMIGFADSNVQDDPLLLRTAQQGGGQFFPAANAAALVSAFNSIITNILERAASFSSASLNSTSLNAGTRLFQAGFNSANWTGTLTATPISTGPTGACPGVDLGRLCSAAWEASTVLNTATPDTRTILTFDKAAKAGIPFRWANLPAAQQGLLNRNPNVLPTLTADTRGQERLSYLRGNRSQEGAGNFRQRGSLLGDIVDSDPFFVGAPDSALPFSGYSAFRSSNANRTPMVYVGANDGMLHGFRVSDGAELMAYVPGTMYGTNANPKLASLTAQPYTHVWGVDGSPTVADVQVGSTPTWATYLIGTMRYGGQGLFALDVTNPAAFSEANARSIVKWEFTDTDDADLGYTFSQPSIVKLKNGKWAAIVGNGYNNREADGSVSTDGRATLFVIFLDGPGPDGIWNLGTDYLKFKAGPTMAAGDVDNALATPAPVDLDGDSLVDYVYAGDLRGDMWQFNLNNIDPTLWAVGYGGNSLFTALSPANIRQPITAAPEVGFNLLTGDPDDLIVFFGTGRYVAAGDNTQSNQQTQSFYGIFSNPIAAASPTMSETSTSPNPLRSSLRQQSILQEISANGLNLRITSNNALDLTVHKGWYVDLVSPAAGSNQGERQIGRPILRDGRIVFTTVIPSENPCDFGGSGWLMEVDAKTGARPSKPALDINNNLTVDVTDVVQVTINGQIINVPTSGIGSTSGMLSTPAVLALTPGQEAKYSVRSDGTTAVFGEAASGRTGRVTWREIAP